MYQIIENGMMDTATTSREGHQGKRVFGLDLLRALAVSLVVICHVILLFPLRESIGEKGSNLFGFLGVELFFVLSGFLIGQILIQEVLRSVNATTSRIRMLWRFLLRRWFRTIPNYLLFLGVSYFGVGYLTAANGYAWKYLFFLQNFTTPMTPFFTVSWSLAIEEWFYLSFGALLFLCSAVAGRNRFAAVITVTVYALFFLLLRWYHVVTENPTWDDGVRKILLFRLDAIAIGVFAAVLKGLSPERWIRWRLPALVGGTGAFALSIALYFWLDLDLSLFARVFLFTLVSCSVALTLPFLDGWKVAKGIIPSTISRLSLWSYSLYLTHGVLVDRMAIRRDILLQLDRTTTVVTIIGFLAISVGVSGVVFHLFEKPMTALRDRFE